MTIFGVNPTNDLADCIRYTGFVGQRPALGGIHFNQDSLGAFRSGISYEVGRARVMRAAGTSAKFSVPFYGPATFLDVAAGRNLDLYADCARQIVGLLDPAGTGKVMIRPPWEGNLAVSFQSNSAQLPNGTWRVTEWKQAWRRIVATFRAVSPRFQFEWCVNFGRGQLPIGLSPEDLYPGDDVVDIVGQDLYFVPAGETLAHVRTPFTGYGIDWLIAFARAHGKSKSIGELGATRDDHAPEIIKTIWFLSDQGFHHALWWDRPDGPYDCEISNRRHPVVGRAVRAGLASQIA